MILCNSVHCPIKKFCENFTTSESGKSYKFFYIGINKNHVGCDDFKSNRKKY